MTIRQANVSFEYTHIRHLWTQTVILRVLLSGRCIHTSTHPTMQAAQTVSEAVIQLTHALATDGFFDAKITGPTPLVMEKMR